MKEVIISNLAQKENNQNVNYVFETFGLKVTLNYLDKYEEIISLLESDFYNGTFDEKLKLYKILVVKQIYILYENLDKNTILIVSVWNNQQFPYWF